ncbi:MAG: acetyl-CoA carboxylase biotin carboxylase subunit [Cytophagaceae bacterium]|jgi:propionyl-CoA carboxylase alpha chain|nr:acetyl-CoA carboxylase biotin carboxylase subunit [Cytophagaceae bacterium]
MKKVLIANRGEIALRIMRSVKEMGIRSVAVYSDADRGAPFVQAADEAWHLPGNSSAETYLQQDLIIEIARKSGADAIHPGYGFLSENAQFAEKVEKSGLIFIGPSSQAMRQMGSKLGAKEAARKFQVPLVPGTEGAINDLEEARQIALSIGFPVLIKASAGGGGKGMRIVHEASELESALERASSEARSAFGDGSVFIEKYIGSPKHIEIQILGDQHGNLVYLFERECSVQRRYQKVVEEAPSPVVSEAMRQAMGDAAVRVAQSCGYYNAGTVEFIVDEQRNFYFLEINTRLQVEHPVTEMITGLDLVKEQIKIARGERLGFTQADLRRNGHALELRVYAEDPANNFLPDIGTLLEYKRPEGPWVRVDDGYEEGMEIPIFYDPMIAKLIVWGANRDQAIERMKKAIDQYTIKGVATTLLFGKFVLSHPEFVNGTFDTHFLSKYFKPEYLADRLSEEELRIAARVLQHHIGEQQKQNIQRYQSQDSWKRR